MYSLGNNDLNISVLMKLEYLKHVLAKGENQEVEFKTSFNNDCIVSLCAFANTEGGLYLLELITLAKL